MQPPHSSEQWFLQRRERQKIELICEKKLLHHATASFFFKAQNEKKEQAIGRSGEKFFIYLLTIPEKGSIMVNHTIKIRRTLMRNTSAFVFTYAFFGFSFWAEVFSPCEELCRN